MARVRRRPPPRHRGEASRTERRGRGDVWASSTTTAPSSRCSPGPGAATSRPPASSAPGRSRPTDSARVLARFDDGTPALVEGHRGKGTVVVWTSTLDQFWNDLALQPVFLPFVHQPGGAPERTGRGDALAHRRTGGGPGRSDGAGVGGARVARGGGARPAASCPSRWPPRATAVTLPEEGPSLPDPGGPGLLHGASGGRGARPAVPHGRERGPVGVVAGAPGSRRAGGPGHAHRGHRARRDRASTTPRPSGARIWRSGSRCGDTCSTRRSRCSSWTRSCPTGSSRQEARDPGIGGGLEQDRTTRVEVLARLDGPVAEVGPSGRRRCGTVAAGHAST